MKPSSRDLQLGLASPLNYVAIQSGKTKTPLIRRRCGLGLDASHTAFRGQGREFFLDILFHRMCDMEMFRQPLRKLPNIFFLRKTLLDVPRERCRWGHTSHLDDLTAKPNLCRSHGSPSVGTAGPAVVDAIGAGTCHSLRLRKAVAMTPKTNRFPAASVHSRPWTPK